MFISLDLLTQRNFSLELKFFGVCLFGVPLAVFAALLFGAFACIQHVILRFTLGLCRYTPVNYIRFLDYATEKVLLYKKEAGYIFIHKLFQDYLAAQCNVQSHHDKVRKH